jgi:hypothetical protein
LRLRPALVLVLPLNRRMFEQGRRCLLNLLWQTTILTGQHDIE